MKKFKFRLEKVLQYRGTIKAERLRELQIAMLELNEAKNHLEYLEHEFSKSQIHPDEQLLVSEVYIRSSYSERLKREVERQIEEIAKRQQVVEAAQEAYVEASRETETLEKFKAKRHEEYLTELAKEEEKYLDELSIQSRSNR